MESIRPSDGQRTKVAAIDLNRKGYRAGERVLFESLFGPRTGTIDSVSGNTAIIGALAVEVRSIDGRVPAGTDEDALVTALRTADQRRATTITAAIERHAADKARILREYGVR